MRNYLKKIILKKLHTKFDCFTPESGCKSRTFNTYTQTNGKENWEKVKKNTKHYLSSI